MHIIIKMINSASARQFKDTTHTQSEYAQVAVIVVLLYIHICINISLCIR